MFVCAPDLCINLSVISLTFLSNWGWTVNIKASLFLHLSANRQKGSASLTLLWLVCVCALTSDTEQKRWGLRCNLVHCFLKSCMEKHSCSHVQWLIWLSFVGLQCNGKTEKTNKEILFHEKNISGPTLGHTVLQWLCRRSQRDSYCSSSMHTCKVQVALKWPISSCGSKPTVIAQFESHFSFFW